MAENWEPYKEFWSWAGNKRNQAKGIDGSGQSAPFILHERLCRYWTLEKITAVVTAFHEMPPRLSELYADNSFRVDYIRIFSTLVVVRRIEYLAAFLDKGVGDDHLPFRPRDATVFPATQEGRQDAWSFYYAQFRFCPVDLDPTKMKDRLLDNRCILPLAMDRVLSKGSERKPKVSKCKLHRTAALSLTATGNVVVLKEYPHASLAEYHNDVRLYETMRNLQNPVQGHEQISRHFVNYYGSFRLCGKGYILLEDVDESLEDLFTMRHGRSYEWSVLDRDTLYEIWESISSLFRALEVLHRLAESEIPGYTGVHLDVNPGNVFPHEVYDQNDAVRLTFKLKWNLVDWRTQSRSKPTELYVAPELRETSKSSSGDQKRGPPTSKADIWSLGFVLFELLVWTVSGERGRQDFRTDWEFEMGHMMSEDLDLEHDHVSVLFQRAKWSKIMYDILDRTLERRRVFDNVTEHVGRFILKNMLVLDPGRRKEAGELWDLFEGLWMGVTGREVGEYERVVRGCERRGVGGEEQEEEYASSSMGSGSSVGDESDGTDGL